MTDEQREAQRLAALYELDLLDSGPDRAYMELVELAAEMCAVPISTISLIDSTRQWFKAAVGLELQEAPRDISICTHTIEQREILMVENLLEDERFRDNPLVTGENAVRFYAGIPLMSDNQPVGTLCIADMIPRTLTDSQRKGLAVLARQAQSRLELHAKQKLLERLSAEKDKLSRSLETRNVMFQAFMDNSPFVSFIKDAEGRFVFYNSAMRTQFHLEGDEWLGKADHDLWPAKIAAEFHAVDVAVMQGGISVVTDEQSPGPGGTTLTWRSYKFPIVNERNETMLGGMAVEMTADNERKAQLERTLAESQELTRSLAHSQAMLRTLLENNPNQCYLKDEDGRYLFYNRKFAEDFHVGEQKWLGKTDFDLLPAALAEQLRAHDLEAINSDHVVETEGELPGAPKDGKIYKVLKFRCVDQDGRRMLAGMAVDISGERERQRQLQRACVELEQQASVDGLTRVLNRRAFDVRLLEEFTQAEAEQRKLSVVLLDIDNFKQRNDQYGHAAGDQVLREVGQALQGCCRRGDTVARVGGEEFAFVLPGTCAEDAERLAERVLARVRAIAPESAPVTASVGVATLDPTTRSAERLYGRADDAMYAAKRTGKNRVVTHSVHLDGLLQGVVHGLTQRGEVREPIAAGAECMATREQMSGRTV